MKIAAMILWLAPHVGQVQAVNYADIIQTESSRHSIDPLLVVALIHRESRFRARAESKKNYGLMQVRVSRTTNPDLIGNEAALFVASLNIKRGLGLLDYWRHYHNRFCKDGLHHWWAHYQWGRRVKNSGSGQRVKKVFDRLRGRFSGRN